MFRRGLILLFAGLLAIAPAAAAQFVRNPVKRPVEIIVPRVTNQYAGNGSSSAQGNNDSTGVSLTVEMAAATRGSTQSILGASQISSEAGGGASDSGVTTQVTASTNSNATRTVQTDLNTTFLGSANIGSPEQRRNWLKSTIIPLLNANVTSQGRLLAWHGTEYGWDATPLFREYRMNRLMWADMPGKVVLTHPYWLRAIPNGPGDETAITAGEFPRSYQIADRSHPGYRGHRLMARTWLIPFVQATEGGLPFFPYHDYFSNVSTAQSNGGAVLTLAYAGSLTGVSLQLIGPDGFPSRDFAIDSSTAAITRSSATVLKNGRYDLRVRSTRGPFTRDDPISIGIGSLSLCACDEMNLDGFLTGYIDSIDNAGSLDSPSYTNGTSREWRGVAGSQTEFSFWARLLPDASVDGVLINVWYQGTGVRITRTAAGGLDVSVRGDDGLTISSSISSGSTCNTGAVTSSCGRRWVFYSVNVASGVSRQRLIVLDDATNTVKYDSTSTAVSAAKTTVTPNPIASGTVDTIFKGATGSPYRGLVARMGFAIKEVDWSVSGNRDAVRAGANSLVDFSANAAADGRSFAVTGSGSYYNGTVTPFFALSGNAADFMHGINAGSAYGLGGEEPSNASLAGGVSYEVSAKRDWKNLNSTQGLAITQ